jgi:alcohol dehydrogenase (NADP+)
MHNAKAYAASSATSSATAASIERREPGERDVQLEILFCGICHSDLHRVRNEWKDALPTVYPCVPGHEIVGRVTKVGSAVTKFQVGDLGAVGCLVDSDGTCPECKAGLEQFCPNPTLTYNSPDKVLGGVTCGGYSDSIVVKEHFVLKVPGNLDLAGAAPLLCAGITTYSPLRHWGVTEGKNVGIVGLGGLEHMGVKFAHALAAAIKENLTKNAGKRPHDVIEVIQKTNASTGQWEMARLSSWQLPHGSSQLLPLGFMDYRDRSSGHRHSIFLE